MTTNATLIETAQRQALTPAVGAYAQGYRAAWRHMLALLGTDCPPEPIPAKSVKSSTQPIQTGAAYTKRLHTAIRAFAAQRNWLGWTVALGEASGASAILALGSDGERLDIGPAFAEGVGIQKNDLPAGAYALDVQANTYTTGGLVRRGKDGGAVEVPSCLNVIGTYINATLRDAVTIVGDLARVMPALAKEDNRPTLMNAALQLDARSAYLRSVGADGFRMACRGDLVAEAEYTLQIPRAVVEFLTAGVIDMDHALWVKQDRVTRTETGRYPDSRTYEYEAISYPTRVGGALLDGRTFGVSWMQAGQYPRVLELLPAQFAGTVAFDTAPVLAHIKQAAPVLRNADDTLYLEVQDGILRGIAASQDVGRYEFQVAGAAASGQALRIAVCSKYLAAALAAGGRVLVGHNTPAGSAQRAVTPLIVVDSEGTMHLIMPMSTR